MTVTQGLAELKLLDKRIMKAIDDGQYVAVMDVKTSAVTPDDMEAKIKASYQSVTNLIDRRAAIKSAIVLSNAITTLEIAGKTYTVASAIEAKGHEMAYTNALMSRIASQMRTAQSTFTSMSEKKKNTAASMAAQVAGVDNAAGNQSETYKQTYDAFMEANPVVLIDPLGVAAKLQTMIDESQAFISEVDVALSVCNATTIITIGEDPNCGCDAGCCPIPGIDPQG